tara:strand:- start:13974 stop:14537 length:564 start_codon:yes stop_codon:yes gene_type:complete
MDDKLKQRIIGALVLVVAAVVFLPMLLSGQDETVKVEIEVPQAPVMDQTEIEAAAPIELPAPEPVAEIPAPEMLPEAPAVSTPAETPVVSAPPAVEKKPVPMQSGNWVVQLGSFSSAANAEALRDTLVGQGYNAYSLSAKVDGSDITRVFVGPLLDRAETNKLRDELASRHGMKGLVTAYDAGTQRR